MKVNKKRIQDSGLTLRTQVYCFTLSVKLAPRQFCQQLCTFHCRMVEILNFGFRLVARTIRAISTIYIYTYIYIYIYIYIVHMIWIQPLFPNTNSSATSWIQSASWKLGLTWAIKLYIYGLVCSHIYWILDGTITYFHQSKKAGMPEHVLYVYIHTYRSRWWR